VKIIFFFLQPKSRITYNHSKSTIWEGSQQKTTSGRSPQEKKGGHESEREGDVDQSQMRKGDIVYYLPVALRILCLISGFSSNTDSARFKVLFTS
jgi:hypothetical protein